MIKIKSVTWEHSTVSCYDSSTYSGRRGLVQLLAQAIDFVESLDDQYLINDIIITPVESGYDWRITFYVEKVANEASTS
jgi:hypothetical protein